MTNRKKKDSASGSRIRSENGMRGIKPFLTGNQDDDNDFEKKKRSVMNGEREIEG